MPIQEGDVENVLVAGIGITKAVALTMYSASAIVGTVMFMSWVMLQMKVLGLATAAPFAVTVGVCCKSVIAAPVTKLTVVKAMVTFTVRVRVVCFTLVY